MASDLRPALIGSAALHLSLLAAGLIAWPHFSRPLPSAPVTVNLVAKAPEADVRPAEEAPTAELAAAPEPAPEPVPVPEPTPAAPAPTPAPPAPEPPKPALDLDALASRLPKPKPQPKLDLNALASRLPRQAANAPKGPLRAETAPQSRTAVGAAQGLTADEASLLASKLNRLWNPNCGAEGAAAIVVKVNIQLTPTGDLAAQPALIGPQSNDPVWQAAAQRALNAASRGAPYDELPRDRYAVWRNVNVNFNGREACRRG